MSSTALLDTTLADSWSGLIPTTEYVRTFFYGGACDRFDRMATGETAPLTCCKTDIFTFLSTFQDSCDSLLISFSIRLFLVLVLVLSIIIVIIVLVIVIIVVLDSSIDNL